MLVSYIHVGKEAPGYKAILKAVLKTQIQMLVSYTHSVPTAFIHTWVTGDPYRQAFDWEFYLYKAKIVNFFKYWTDRDRSGSVVECLT